jgi:beta-glucosidase/6-phospho-beta-glucosidase/beta-galactosidase
VQCTEAKNIERGSLERVGINGPDLGAMSRHDVALPREFLWGTATPAYQIEGGNVNSDWAYCERAPGTRAVEPGGDACQSWNRYLEDVDIVHSLGLNAYRFSIEWDGGISRRDGGLVSARRTR